MRRLRELNQISLRAVSLTPSSVKLISGTLSHRNTGNQFVHPAAIFTFIFLALTAVFQILCLNRGLRAYDSTLVVPVFYGVVSPVVLSHECPDIRS